MDEREIDRILKSTNASLEQDKEIERVLKAFRLNHYDVLGLKLAASDDDIRRAYRRKSLLIHPDKTSNKNAIPAFDLLAKAHTALLDPEQRNPLDEVVIYATRRQLIASCPQTFKKDWKWDALEAAPYLAREKDGLPVDFEAQVSETIKTTLVEEELARRRTARLAMAKQGEEERKVDEAVSKRRRELEEKKGWEDTREERVAGWRNFAKAGGPVKKKSKKASGVLG